MSTWSRGGCFGEDSEVVLQSQFSGTWLSTTYFKKSVETPSKTMSEEDHQAALKPRTAPMRKPTTKGRFETTGRNSLISSWGEAGSILIRGSSHSGDGVRPSSLRKGRVLRIKTAMATAAAMIFPILLRIKPVRNPPRDRGLGGIGLG
jgi:hypothetical protein